MDQATIDERLNALSGEKVSIFCTSKDCCSGFEISGFLGIDDGLYTVVAKGGNCYFDPSAIVSINSNTIKLRLIS